MMSSISTVNFSSSFGVLLFSAYIEIVSRASVDCIQTVIFTASECSDILLSATTNRQNLTQKSVTGKPPNDLQRYYKLMIKIIRAKKHLLNLPVR